MTAVAFRGVSKRFGDAVALDDVTIDVRSGEIVALLGPSGCGKTTFLRVAAGFERPEAGAVELAGEIVDDARRFVPPERRRAPLVFQDYALFPHMSVAQNVGYGVPRAERDARVAEMLGLVGLDGLEARYPHELSGGQQQRVALARALAAQPAIVLLDEPFSNLDADLRQRVRTEVRDIIRAAAATAIFVTHDQAEAFEIADRVGVMRAGRLEQLGSPGEVYHVPETRFVADFVGRAAFVPASVRDGAVECELGSFALAEPLDEGPAELMVRPEDVAVGAAGSGIDADVIERRFQGPVSISTIRLPSGLTVDSAHSSQRSFALGERVSVRFRPDHVVVFRGERMLSVCAPSTPPRPASGSPTPH